MAFATVGLIAGGLTAASGIVSAIGGGIKAKKAKEEARKAKAELEKQKTRFENLDTSNPYMNMENTMEDLTVNQQEAEFMKQQQQQNQANILQQMRGAAGGSGIAALAQTLANQGSLDAQKAATSIGKQEQANQLAERQEASRLQGLEREGELISRQAEFGKISSLMGMSADALANAKAEQAAGQQQMMGGINQAVGAFSGVATGQFGAGAQAKLGGMFGGGQ
tara:strand:- start:2531 stop:3199 length:669 start_codon:yes stop_codon:yes gene_type:complete